MEGQLMKLLLIFTIRLEPSWTAVNNIRLIDDVRDCPMISPSRVIAWLLWPVLALGSAVALAEPVEGAAKALHLSLIHI